MFSDARIGWQQIVSAPENEAAFLPYHHALAEPRTLFDAIGEDLSSAREETRARAFAALVVAMPELTNILHERASTRPGWREGTAAHQELINRGMDILTHLYKVLVLQGRFRPILEDGATMLHLDPRPLVRRVANNWQLDAARRAPTVLSLDRLLEMDSHAWAVSSVGSAVTPPVEEQALSANYFEDTQRELDAMGFLSSGEELALFMGIYVDNTPLEEMQQYLGIPTNDALRQRLSRAKRRFLFARDSIIMTILHLLSDECWRDRVVQKLEECGWDQRLWLAIDPKVTRMPIFKCPNDVSVHFIVLSITRPIGRTPSQLEAVWHDFPPLNNQLNVAPSLWKTHDAFAIRLASVSGVPPLEPYVKRARRSSCDPRILTDLNLNGRFLAWLSDTSEAKLALLERDYIARCAPNLLQEFEVSRWWREHAPR
jgi:hypothetical protein